MRFYTRRFFSSLLELRPVIPDLYARDDPTHGDPECQPGSRAAFVVVVQNGRAVVANQALARCAVVAVNAIVVVQYIGSR
jgi:hypothetical protein